MKLSKSKLALAKVINENGGWADDSVYAANDEGGIICGYSSKPIRRKTTPYHWSGSERNTWIRGIKTQQWHQCVLSREEYYQAYPKADDDGWIEWNGGIKGPVEYGVPVDVKTKDGNEYYEQLLGDACWHDNFGDENIIAYRLHRSDVKPEFCESVMRSIPDPESKPTSEQLAQDYRNAKYYALRLQEEANDAWTAAEKAKGELIDAGKVLGLVLSVAEPELVITDWRDLRVNDVIFVDEYDGHESGEYVVVSLEDDDYDGDYAVMATGIDGCDRWIDTTVEWRLIRRP